MKHNDSLERLPEKNFELVKQYVNTGRCDAMSPEVRRLLDLVVEAYGVLRQCPQRDMAIKRLMALHKDQEMSYQTARRFVDFTRQTYGQYIDTSREFLETFFVDRLLAELSNPDNDARTTQGYMSMLRAHLEKMPERTVDPRLMEANTINIQFNIGQKSVSLSEETLAALPEAARAALLEAATARPIESDEEAEALLAR